MVSADFAHRGYLRLALGLDGAAGMVQPDRSAPGSPKCPALIWLTAWIVIPAVLLSLAATRMNVFHPRYLIAITPVLLLLTALATWRGAKG